MPRAGPGARGAARRTAPTDRPMAQAAARPDHLDLAPVARVAGAVALPGSKSISNRTLLLAALAAGATRDRRAARLRRHGAHARGAPGARHRLAGDRRAWGLPRAGVRRRRSGQAARRCFSATPARRSGRSPRCSRCRAATYRLVGRPAHARAADRRPRRRAARARCRDRLPREGGLSRRSRSARRGLRPRRAVRVRGDVSSQFLTALLMALPLAGRRVAVDVAGELISKPYVEITLNSMQRFGVAVERAGWRRFVVPAGARYRSPGDDPRRRATRRRRRISSRPARSAAARCASRASGAPASRATCASSRCSTRWARASRSATTGSRCAARARCARSTST